MLTACLPWQINQSTCPPTSGRQPARWQAGSSTHPIIHSPNQSLTQSITHPINHSPNQSFNLSAHWRINHSIIQSFNQSTNQNPKP
jgi:hypothetical protein